MNIYEAYLEVKKGNIIRVGILHDVYYIMETSELPIKRKRIIQIELTDAIEYYKSVEELDPDVINDLKDICLSSFADDTSFKIVSYAEMMEEIRMKWKDGHK
jgi:hypothetical protein